MANGRAQLVAFALLGVLLLGGCHARPGMHGYAHAPLPRDDYGQARSLVMPSRVVQAYQILSGQAPPIEPWYDGRNDWVPSVTAGYQSIVYERSVTYTRDHQSISNGRVYDRYNESTYRRTVRESVR